MSNSELRADVSALRQNPRADVLIIGGGINGIATARDLALQGVSVALVERNDFGSGASAASSHMVHGGIRYLENAEFRLVRESVRERNDLLRTAPHLVKPLRTTVPIYSLWSGLFSAPLRFLRHGKGKRTERGAALIKIGLVVYDSFSGNGTVPGHEFHGRKRSREMLPDLNPRVRYTASYWDASMPFPERLALDVLGDAKDTGNARAANYVAAVGATAAGVTLRDAETGAEFSFQASVVINASGPWTDLTDRALGHPTRFMGGTKGSHIVLDHPALLHATGGREIFFEHKDGRIVLIYPLNDRVLVGTSDLEHDIAEPVLCTEAEVDYFLDLIRGVFPRIDVGRTDIVYRYSGVRPLPHHDDMAPGFVSRDYRIEQLDLYGTPMLGLVGGKWTTFRAVAEHLADETLQLLGRDRICGTLGLSIGGGQGFPRTERARSQWVGQAPWGRQLANTRLNRYGTKATELCADIPAGDAPVRTAPDYTAGELTAIARAEQVVHLDDLVLRRTWIGFSGRATDQVIAEIAEILAPVLGWTQDRVDAEIQRCRAAVTAFVPAAGASEPVSNPASDPVVDPVAMESR